MLQRFWLLSSSVFRDGQNYVYIYKWCIFSFLAGKAPKCVVLQRLANNVVVPRENAQH
jgi:hypothetical protein